MTGFRLRSVQEWLLTCLPFLQPQTLFWGKIFITIPDYLSTSYIVQAGFEFAIILPQPPRFWNIGKAFCCFHYWGLNLGSFAYRLHHWVILSSENLCRLPLYWNLRVFLIIRLGSWGSGRGTANVKCYFHHILPRVTLSAWFDCWHWTLLKQF